MACWTYLAFVEQIITYEEVALNTTTDPDVVEFCKDAIEIAQAHKKKLSEFLKRERIPMPEALHDKPKTDPRTVPVGVAFTDSELLWKVDGCLQLF